MNRRNLLKLLGGGALAAAVAPLVPSSAQERQQPAQVDAIAPELDEFGNRWRRWEPSYGTPNNLWPNALEIPAGESVSLIGAEVQIDRATPDDWYLRFNITTGGGRPNEVMLQESLDGGRTWRDVPRTSS